MGYDDVGVDSGEDGHSCTAHDKCGLYLNDRDILVCHWTLQQFGAELVPVSCKQAHKIVHNGLPCCHVRHWLIIGPWD